MRLWLRLSPTRMLYSELEMPHWLVIDLEATTDDGGWPLAEMEIIEIGATLVNREGRELDHFQRFVRPLRRPLLTLFCRELTHISQAQIDGAAPLGEVWPLFERWLGQHQARLEGWASWGDYDRRQLEQDWRQLGLSSALGQVPHINLKQRFAKARRLERPLGLNGALQLAGLQFNGQQHRALEDARNTARLLPLSLPN
jgi:inhibitor of KinA sporulation pathway (predicted exonuclease)